MPEGPSGYKGAEEVSEPRGFHTVMSGVWNSSLGSWSVLGRKLLDNSVFNVGRFACSASLIPFLAIFLLP